MSKFTALIGALSFLFTIVSCSNVESIDNKITKDHIEAGSTGIYLLLPVQFEAKSDFDGFVHIYTDSYVHVDQLKKPYSKAVDNYIAFLDESKISSIQKTEYLVNGMEANFITYSAQENDDGYTFQVLIFGNESKTTRIEAKVISEFDDLIADDIKESLLSVAFKKY